MTDNPITAEDILDAAAPLPDPTPLRAPRRPVAFPVAALPGWASAWVTAEATATQTPEDLAGCCVLGVLAACAGGRAVVQARGGWREPVNLYLLPVMPPGSRKSAVISAATRPLYDAEEDLAAAVREQMIETLILRGIAEKAAEKGQRSAANADSKDQRDRLSAEAVSASQTAEAITVPTIPRLIADDVTPEAVGSLLAAHGGRLAIISAEGGVFETIGGRYSAGIPNLDVWLKGHAGDPLRIDRKGRPSEYVKAPALTLLLTVQPVVLGGLARNGTFRGRGLTARFLFALPPDTVGRRIIGAPPVPDGVAVTYEKRVRGLVEEMAGWTDPAILQLAPEAHELLLQFERAVEPRLARDGEYGPIREWASKLVGAVLRIAGLLHLADDDGQRFRMPISEATLRSAITCGAYFVDHAQAAFDLLGDGGAGDGTYLLEFLRRRQVERFTIRSLLTDLPRGRFASTEDVAVTVEVLVEHGWVVPVPPPPRAGAGRPPSPSYRCHPSVLDEEVPFTPAKVPAESAQSAEPPNAPSSADTADNAETSDDDPGPGSADCADSADTSTGATCLGCGKPLSDGAVGCGTCYAAGRIDDDGRSSA